MHSHGNSPVSRSCTALEISQNSTFLSPSCFHQTQLQIENRQTVMRPMQPTRSTSSPPRFQYVSVIKRHISRRNYNKTPPVDNK